jgi:hypothetical protein
VKTEDDKEGVLDVRNKELLFGPEVGGFTMY